MTVPCRTSADELTHDLAESRATERYKLCQNSARRDVRNGDYDSDTIAAAITFDRGPHGENHDPVGALLDLLRLPDGTPHFDVERAAKKACQRYWWALEDYLAEELYRGGYPYEPL